MSPARSEPIPTYGGRPALKPSIYGWLVGLYIVVGGTAGAIQILATLVDFAGPAAAENLVVTARVLALAGAVAGGILLIVELHTRQRFYNMLRIFRPTSPMSIGSYVLTGFGFFSLLAVAAHLLGIRWLALICGALASLFGLAMTTYPAALLATTSTPLWAAAPRLLAVRFAASSIASGAALLCLLALWPLPQASLVYLFAAVAAVSLAVELGASIIAQLEYARQGVDGPLRDRYGLLHLAGAQLIGSALPILLFAAGAVAVPATWPLMTTASVLTIAGGYVMRGVILLAGNESARRPVDYFRFASGAPPGNTARPTNEH